jgi:hypothetical protein
MLFDYRANSPQTSETIQELYYRSTLPPRRRARAVRKAADDAGTVLLCGHFRVEKYWNAFDHDRFLSVVRHPLDRLVSAYNRHLRRGQVSMPFEEFALSREINLQSNRLGGVPLEEIGFIGLTERFEQSIDLLNRTYGLDLGVFKSSRKPLFSRGIKKSDLSPALINEIATTHAEDMALYEHAVVLFEKRAAGAS